MCLGGRSQALLLPIMICSSLNYTGRIKPDSASARANLQVKVQTGRPPGDNIDAGKRLKHPHGEKQTKRDHSSVIDAFEGKLLEGSLIFQQNFLIRSNELSPDGKVHLEGLVNRLQESGLDHFKSVGLAAEGFCSTPEMSRRNLICVVCRLQIVVERLPSWGDARCSSGILDICIGKAWSYARLACPRLQDRRNSPASNQEAWAEIKPHVLYCHPIIMGVRGDNRKLLQILDVDTADYVRTGLSPLWNDLDINQHVNHIKYISWILEGAPRSFLESHKLSTMTLEYRKECGRESMLHNLSAVRRNGTSATNTDHFTEDEGIEFDHSLYLQDGSEVLRA